jgi:hypothetical protein
MAHIFDLTKTGYVGIKEDFLGHIGPFILKQIVVFVPFLLKKLFEF